MNYELWNAAAITILALAGLWIFGRSVVQRKEKSPDGDKQKKSRAE